MVIAIMLMLRNFIYKLENNGEIQVYIKSKFEKEWR